MRFPTRFVIPLFAVTLGVMSGAAQTRTISGRVLNRATQEGIPGAIITLSGTPRGTQGDADGRFRLTAPSEAVTLDVRSIGYRRQSIAVPSDQSEITISLDRDVLKLEQVVVTGTATTMQRVHTPTATQMLDAQEVSRAPSSDLNNALQGKVIGARINMNSGAPGGGGQIQLRGVTSLNGQGDPLFVVDGVLISNASIPSGANSITRASGTAPSSTQDNMLNRLADINPNDIESIQVLKSAAATAQYGSRGTNGVVLIRTKRGVAGAPRFSVTQRVGMSSPLKLLGSRRFQDTTALIAAAGGAAGRQFVRDSLANRPIPYFDYQDQLFSQGSPSYETLVSVGGGSENGTTRYSVSASNRYDEGTMINTYAKKQSVRMSVVQLFGQRWDLDVGANIYRTIAARGLSNNDNTNTSPYYAFAYTPAVIDLNRVDATGTYIRNPFPGGGGVFASNPFENMAYIRNDEDVFRQIGNFSLGFKAFETDVHRVDFRLIGGIDRFNQDNQIFAPNFLQFEPRDNLLGTAMQGNALSRQYNTALSAIYTFTPSNRWFSSTTSVGYTADNRYLNIYRIQGRGLLPGVPLANQGLTQLNHTITDIADRAYYAQEELLAFDDRLNLTGGLRAERSSVNGDRDKYFVFPKFAASYRFVSPVRFVDNVKLRASYGKSGNQPDYGRRDLVLAGSGLIDGQTGLAAASVLGNPDIEPEKLTEAEYGLDASFLGDRLGFEGSYFKRTVDDMFLFAPLPTTSGLTSQVINAGEMETDGWEIGVTAVPVRVRGFDWVTRANFYTFEGLITELPVPAFITSSGFGVAYGRARAACPGFTAAGTPTMSTLGRCGGSGLVNGQRVTFEPISVTAIWGNRYRCDADHRRSTGCTLDSTFVDTIVGDATPDFEMSFSNDFSWRAFNLSVLVDWRKGGDVSNMTNNLFDEGQNSWDYDHPSPDPSMGRTLGEYRYNKWSDGLNSTVYIQDGSYVKLREVTLAYQLPGTFVSRYVPRVRDIRLSLSGRNLKMWSDYWGVDPEVNNFGNANVARQVDLAPYPPARTWMFSVDVGF